MYRLFIGTYGLEVDLDSQGVHQHRTAPAPLNSEQSVGDNELLTKASLQAITGSQTLPIALRPFKERFDFAVNTRHWSASLFTDMVNADTTEQLALHRDGRGKTALHWTAERFGYWLRWSVMREIVERNFGSAEHISDCLRDHSSMLIDLLEAGANISAATSSCETPLACMLQMLMSFQCVTYMYEKEEEEVWELQKQTILNSAIRQWGVIIANSGRSLQEYVSSETRSQRCLANKGHRYPWLKGSTFGVEGLYLLDDSSLGMRIWHETKIQTWKLRLPPGTWPPKKHMLDTICWEPSSHERHLWRPHDVHVLPSPSYDFRSQDLSDQGSLGGRSTHDHAKKLLLSTQDDHGPIADLLRRFLLNLEQQCMQDEKSQWQSAAQQGSFMSPYPISNHEQEDVLRLKGPDGVTGFGYGIHWFESIHRCLIDNKWKVISEWRISEDLYDRHKQCMDGACEENHPHWIWSDFWVVRLLEDKDTIDVAKRFISRFWPKAVTGMEFKIGSAKQDDEVRQFLETS